MVSLTPARVDVKVLDGLHPEWHAVLGPAEAIGMVALSGSTLSFRHEVGPAGRRA
jgi:hypothetical protein